MALSRESSSRDVIDWLRSKSLDDCVAEFEGRYSFKSAKWRALNVLCLYKI